MQINEVIRKYRKEKKLTQEEMANRLGVTAPAVNKWESGASMPDISLLAPIARLLDISLDELLSFKDKLTEVEISNIGIEFSAMLSKNPLETVYQKMVQIIREYPNDENLILTLTTMLNTRCLLLGGGECEKYDSWIQGCYESLLSSGDEMIRHDAADGLYAFLLRRERYEEAEKTLDYFSPWDPGKKRKLAAIYSRTGRYEEACQALEELLLSDYQQMSVVLYGLHVVAIKTGNQEKARIIVEKESALAELLEMGKYHQLAGRLDYALSVQDTKKALDLMDALLTHVDTAMDYTQSALFEHMTFPETGAGHTEQMTAALLKQFSEDETCRFVRETPEWEAFRAKWCGQQAGTDK
ncbi:MAG: helix-turn-helix domain-containing protein [Clostridia bacterium]|nr:helix-turn-helix domain-containing protein [Clostridia bacterium]